MNKLTAEILQQLKSAAQEEIMCREASDTSDAWQDLASPENVLALIEIALPVLEQKPIDWWEEMEMLERDLGSKHRTYVKWRKRAEDAEAKLAELGQECQPSTNPQIDNDVWIEWRGGNCPTPESAVVRVRYRGEFQDDNCIAGSMIWAHSGEEDDIIAYRVIDNDGREE